MSIYKTVNECMIAPNKDVEEQGKKMGVSHITLDSKDGKLKMCQQISGHQQQIFLRNGINKSLTTTLDKQKSHCDSLCK